MTSRNRYSNDFSYWKSLHEAVSRKHAHINHKDKVLLKSHGYKYICFNCPHAHTNWSAVRDYFLSSTFLILEEKHWEWMNIHPDMDDFKKLTAGLQSLTKYASLIKKFFMKDLSFYALHTLMLLLLLTYLPIILIDSFAPYVLRKKKQILTLFTNMAHFWTCDKVWLMSVSVTFASTRWQFTKCRSGSKTRLALTQPLVDQSSPNFGWM